MNAVDILPELKPNKAELHALVATAIVNADNALREITRARFVSNAQQKLILDGLTRESVQHIAHLRDFERALQMDGAR